LRARAERSSRISTTKAGGFLNIADTVRKAPADAHFMLNAFKAATSALALEFVHLEYFSAQEDAAREGGFEVVLARQKRSLFVPQARRFSRC
jgi:tetrachlorobenzoquinone reductase